MQQFEHASAARLTKDRPQVHAVNGLENIVSPFVHRAAAHDTRRLRFPTHIVGEIAPDLFARGNCIRDSVFGVHALPGRIADQKHRFHGAIGLEQR
ncbi:MAG TPA: hypothetical protein VHE09_12025, partial [Rhizomicrobium sp.]|nr:hypothetical protein [Rhizomicrobium sp.]